MDNMRWKGDYPGTGNKSTSTGVSPGITHAFQSRLANRVGRHHGAGGFRFTAKASC
jgi:hypothetical protein